MCDPKATPPQLCPGPPTKPCPQCGKVRQVSSFSRIVPHCTLKTSGSLAADTVCVSWFAGSRRVPAPAAHLPPRLRARLARRRPRLQGLLLPQHRLDPPRRRRHRLGRRPHLARSLVRFPSVSSRAGPLCNGQLGLKATSPPPLPPAQTRTHCTGLAACLASRAPHLEPHQMVLLSACRSAARRLRERARPLAMAKARPWPRGAHCHLTATMMTLLQLHQPGPKLTVHSSTQGTPKCTLSPTGKFPPVYCTLGCSSVADCPSGQVPPIDPPPPHPPPACIRPFSLDSCLHAIHERRRAGCNDCCGSGRQDGVLQAPAAWWRMRIRLPLRPRLDGLSICACRVCKTVC